MTNNDDIDFTFADINCSLDLDIKIAHLDTSIVKMSFTI